MATDSKPIQPKRPADLGSRRSRTAAWIVVPIIALMVVGGLVYRHYSRAERIRAVAEAYLQQYAYGAVSVGSASFSLFKGIRLFDVAVAEAPSPGNESARPRPVFSCREVRLACDLLAALSGRLKIESIVASEPTFTIVRNGADGRTNLTGLLRLPDVRGVDAVHLPTIEFRDANVSVVRREGDRDRVVEDLRITVRALPSKHDDLVYDVAWQGGNGRVASGHWRIDLLSGGFLNVRGGLPRMSIEAVMLAINATYDGAGAWCDLLGLKGTVRVVDFRFNGVARAGSGASRDIRDDAPAEPTGSATIELNEASISIPISNEELLLSPEDRYLRFERVDGRVQLTADEIRATFAGLFHGSECNVSATVRGGVEKPVTLDDVDFDVRLSIVGLNLPRPDPESFPAQMRFINRWRSLAKFYRDYDPHGSVDLDIEATKKSGGDEPIVVSRAVLTARGGDASCRYLPYRVHDLQGSIEYNQEGVFIRGLRGEHNGGVVTVDAWVPKPFARGARRISITGKGIPIDEQLFQALPETYDGIRAQFDPRGRFDVQVELTHSAGSDGRPAGWESNSTIQLRDVSAGYVGFPYPLDHLTGTLRWVSHGFGRVDHGFSRGVLESGAEFASPTSKEVGRSPSKEVGRSEDVDHSVRLQFVDVVGYCGEARVGVEGTVTFDAGELTGLNLAIRGKDVAFDDALLSALPADNRKHLAVFHPRGRFDLDASLDLNSKTKRVEFSSNVVVNDITIRHEGFPAEVTGISGRLQIKSEEIIISGLQGRYGDASVSAEGSVRTATGKPISVDLVVRTRDLRLDETLKAAMPPKAREAIGDWKIDGPIATETVIRTVPDDILGVVRASGRVAHGYSRGIHESSAEFVPPFTLPNRSRSAKEVGHPTYLGHTLHTTVRLAGVMVRHPFFPVPFRDVKAEITVDRTGMRATGMKARYGQASISVDLDLRRTLEGEHGTIKLGATRVALDESLRGLLPERMAAAWDRLHPMGSINLNLDRLRFDRSGADRLPEWSIAGYVELNDVSLRGAAGIERMSGTLVGSGSIVDRLGGTSVGGTVTLSTVDVLGQRLNRSESPWSYARTADGKGRFALPSIQSRIYDGSLTGRLEVAFDAKSANYSLATTVHGMRINPLIDADRASRPQDNRHGDSPVVSGVRHRIRGVANGHLYVSGVVGDPRRKLGGGRFEIVDGHIYRLPIILALLNVLNLSLPEREAFNDVKAEFFIMGNRVQLEDIVLRGSALSLVGSGSMTLPDRAVDLSLVNVGPHRWARVPVLAEFVEGASRELVELHVTGPLSQPTVRARPFRRISEEFKRLFQKKKPKNK